MRTLCIFALGLALASSAVANTLVDFNAPDDFTTYFSSSQSGGIMASPSGGLNDSGSLDLTSLSSNLQIITFNQGFSPTTASWTASIYFYGNAQEFRQFGVTTMAAPDFDEYGYPGWEGNTLSSAWMETGNDSGGTLGLTSYTSVPFGVEQWESIAVEGGLPASDAWYRYTISGTYLGYDEYDFHAVLHQANADGTVGDQLAEVSLYVVNMGLSTSESLYFYINPMQGVTIDNFYTDLAAIPEPGTLSALFAGAAVLAWHRRRARK